MPRHEVLGERLAGFQGGCRPGGAHDAPAGGGEQVHNAVTKGQFRTHHGQIHALAFGDAKEGWRLGNVRRDAPGLAGDAGVPRRAQDLHAAFSGKRAGQGVFAPAPSDDENLHGRYQTVPGGPVAKANLGYTTATSISLTSGPVAPRIRAGL